VTGPPPASTAQEASVYRCVPCGHGTHLEAWGNASVHGPLAADGEIEGYDWDELWQVHEDSIQCTGHPGAALEKKIGGRWHRWWNCPRCHGSGRAGTSWPVQDGYPCPEEGIPDAERGGRGRVHGGWWPAGEEPPSPDRLGHVFTRAGDWACRYCGRPSSEQPCPGDRHTCPAAVPEGATDTATRIHGAAGWCCYQPGIMSEGFTGWRCNAGHVTTRDGHVPAGQQHSDVCHHLGFPGCPWPYLADAA